MLCSSRSSLSASGKTILPMLTISSLCILNFTIKYKGLQLNKSENLNTISEK